MAAKKTIKRKANRESIHRVVREHIRAGRSQKQIIDLMKRAGYSASYLAEARKVYTKEKQFVQRMRTGKNPGVVSAIKKIGGKALKVAGGAVKGAARAAKNPRDRRKSVSEKNFTQHASLWYSQGKSTAYVVAKLRGYGFNVSESKRIAREARVPSRYDVRVFGKNPGYTDLVIRGTAKKTPTGWKVGSKSFPQGKGTVKVSSNYYLDRATGTVYAKRQRNPSDTSQKFSPLSDAQLSAKYSQAKAEFKGLEKEKRAVLAALNSIDGRGTKGWGQGRPPQPLLDSYKSAKRLYEETFTHAAKLDDWIARAADELKSRHKSRKNVAQGFYDASGIFHPIRSSTDYDEGRVGTTTRKKAAKNAKAKAGSSARFGATKKAKSSVKSLASRRLARTTSTGKRLKSRKRNDGATERREEFAGKSPGQKELYFPQGTPGGLSTLGPLVLICTEVGDLQPQANGLYLAQDGKEKLYVGSSRNGAVAEPDTDFRKVTRIEYRCKKPHIGEPKDVIWFHDFEAPLPRLRSDSDGALHFEGGDYRIKREGIVG